LPRSLINFTASNALEELLPSLYIGLLLPKSFFKKYKDLLSYSSILLFCDYSYLLIYIIRAITDL